MRAASRRSNHRGRRGLGVAIYLAALTLLTLLGITLHRLMESSASLGQAAVGAGGAVAEEMAISAIAEALWHFQAEGNDPDHPLSATIRSRLQQATPDTPIDLSRELSPDLLMKSLAEDPASRSFKSVTLREFKAVLRPPGRPGDLYLTCTMEVELPFGCVIRTVSESHPFGLDPVFVPQPLDQLSAGLLRAGVLSKQIPTAIQFMDALESFNWHLSRYRASVERAIQQIEAGALPQTFRIMPVFISLAPLPSFTAEEHAALGRLFTQEPWRAKEQAMGRTGPATLRRDLDWLEETPLHFPVTSQVSLAGDRIPAPVPPNPMVLDTTPSAASVVSFADSLDLAAWDPNTRFLEHRRRAFYTLIQLSRKVNTLNSNYQQDEALRSSAADGGLQRYVEEMNQLLKEMRAAFLQGALDYNEFTREMLGETRSAPALPGAAIPTVFPTVVASLTPDRMRRLMEKRKGTNGLVTLEPEPAEIEKIRKKLEEDPDARIDPPPLVLDLCKWEGKTLFQTQHIYAGLVIKKITRAAGGKDRIALVDRSKDGILFEGGPVQAAILAPAATFRSRVDVEGALVLGDYPFKDPGILGTPAVDGLQGSLTRDRSHISGLYQDPTLLPPEWNRVVAESYVLMLDPRNWDRTLGRKARP